MSRWTHAACDDCFVARHPEHITPARMVEQYRRAETCCYCGKQTRSGLYDRNDPELTECLGRNGSAHLEPEEATS